MTKQQVSDPSKGRYFLQMLNMSDDDLSPYQFRLLGHYIRVASKTGKCWEGVRKTAQITQMSIGMVTKTRNELVTLGYIRVKHREDDTCVVVIVDRMAENIARYAHEAVADEADEFDAPTGKRSSGERGVHVVREGVHVVNTLEGSSVHVVNERIQEPVVEPKKKITTFASIDAQVSQTSDWTVADEADEYQHLPLGKQQISKRAEKAEKKLQQPTTPPSDCAAVPPKEKSILAWLIDDRWANSKGKRSDPQGQSSRLIPVLMGTSKKHDTVNPAASEDEIMAFSIWYRETHQNTSLPMESKLASWFGQFRGLADYARRVKEAAYYVEKIYHAAPLPPEPEREIVPMDDPQAVAAYAMMDDLIRKAEAGL